MSSIQSEPMRDSALCDRVQHHLEVLSVAIGARCPGSPANRRATDHVTATLRDAGRRVETQPFRTRTWVPGAVRVSVDDRILAAGVSPFSRPMVVDGPVIALRSVADLAAVERAEKRIAILTGELAESSLFPINYPFLSMPEQQPIFEWLERARPSVVLVTAVDGSFRPMIEDGDLSVPYATIDRRAGDAVINAGRATVEIGGNVSEGDGVNVSSPGCRGWHAPVVMAHVDSKATTPGALDNATGVAALLALVDMQAMPDDIGLIVFNGEDHYAAPGEQAWLAEHDQAEVTLAINLDGIGLRGVPTGVAAMGLPERVADLVAASIEVDRGLVADEPWYESDHAIFAMAGVPALALTSAAPHDVLERIGHGPEGGIDAIEVHRVAHAANFVAHLLHRPG